MTLDELLSAAGAELDRLSQAHEPPPDHVSAHVRRRWPAAAAALVAAGVAALWITAAGRDDAITVVSDPGATFANPIDSSAPATNPGSSSAPATSTQSSTAPEPPLTRTLTKGSSGDDVRMLERRLDELGYVVGPIDGQFDSTLQQAVWAFKKLDLGTAPEELDASQSATAVTPRTWESVAVATPIAPRRPSGDTSTHIEIYLPQQVLVVFSANEPVLIAHISSGELDGDGRPVAFCEVGTYDTDEGGDPLDPPQERTYCADAKTPGGVFNVSRTYHGKRVSPLGGMTDPVYFDYGIAVHGAANVPLHRVSHGAVRVNDTVAAELLSLVGVGDVVYVWGEDGRQPEQYTRVESLPSFNRPPP